MRDFRNLKKISDYEMLDIPESVICPHPAIPVENEFYILRMLVRPKYGDFRIPESLGFLSDTIRLLSQYDRERTGIYDSWCYVTIRHGEVSSKTDDDFHFDGASFRTDIIPERNYVWVNHTGTEYKTGELKFPSDFNPLLHNIFTFVENRLKDKPIERMDAKQWYMLSPFCLHRRPKITNGVKRTFYRICFSDIEGRDINNTNNPLIPTPFYGRNPVDSFRNKLLDYDQ